MIQWMLWGGIPVLIWILMEYKSGITVGDVLIYVPVFLMFGWFAMFFYMFKYADVVIKPKEKS